MVKDNMLKPTKQTPLTATASATKDPDLIDRIIEMLRAEFPGLADDLVQYESDLRAEFAGDRSYIRGMPATDRQKRVSSVLGMLANGRNATTIARKLEISRPTVYRIIKQAAQPPKPQRMI